jgi:sigma-B regulation protein RsbU (phosphoserine phosphatase)
MFTTAFYMVADLERGQICYANAGHPKPLLLRRSTNEVEVLSNASGKCCPALGLFDGSCYTTSHSPIRPGDLALLFTDGLYDVEGPHQDQFNPDWLLTEVQKRIACPARELIDSLLEDIQQRCDHTGFADDVCVVGMEVLAQPGV